MLWLLAAAKKETHTAMPEERKEREGERRKGKLRISHLEYV